MLTLKLRQVLADISSRGRTSLMEAGSACLHFYDTAVFYASDSWPLASWDRGKSAPGALSCPAVPFPSLTCLQQHRPLGLEHRTCRNIEESAAIVRALIMVSRFVARD